MERLILLRDVPGKSCRILQKYENRPRRRTIREVAELGAILPGPGFLSRDSYHPIRRIQYFMNFLIILQEQLSRVIKNNPRVILIEEIMYARHLNNSE